MREEKATTKIRVKSNENYIWSGNSTMLMSLCCGEEEHKKVEEYKRSRKWLKEWLDVK